MLGGIGMPCEQIRIGLESFSSHMDKSPGRFNLLEMNGATVIVDYGHNPSSLQAIIDAVKLFPHVHRTAIYWAAGDRRDCDMIQQGEQLAVAFDRVVIYEDTYLRGRESGRHHQALQARAFDGWSSLRNSRFCGLEESGQTDFADDSAWRTSAGSSRRYRRSDAIPSRLLCWSDCQP